MKLIERSFGRLKGFLAAASILIGILTPTQYAWSQSNASGLVNVDHSIKGFSDIYLGEDISLLSNYNLTFMDSDGRPDADGCFKYECHSKSADAGTDLDLDMVGIRTYKNKIINIYLFFEKQNGYQIFQSFVDKYGKCTERVGDFTYNWNVDDVKLCLSYDKEDLGIAVFSSKRLADQIEIAHKQLAAQ